MATPKAQSDLIELLRELCRRAGRPAEDTELRAALEQLGAAEEAALRKAGRGPAPARPLGPFAWLDVARGIAPPVAAARELGGYYTLLAERDALAAMLGPGGTRPPAGARAPRQEHDAGEPESGSAHASAARHDAEPARESRAAEPGRAAKSDRAAAPGRAAKASRAAESGRDAASDRDAEPARARQSRAAKPARAAPARAVVQEEDETVFRARPRNPASRHETPAAAAARAAHLLGLFAYHRDAPLVARALGIPLPDLERELDALQLRRKAMRLVRGVDADLPAATAIRGGQSGPPLRRRPKEPGAAADEKPEAPLAALLREVGPRRPLLAERLGTDGKPLSDAELLARFSAAGLDRALAEGERNLLRELVQDHRGSTAAAARALGVTAQQWKTIVVERGLSRELIALRDRYRKEAREQTWPRNRIEQVLHHRQWLEELGLWDEFYREVETRVRLLWKDLRKNRMALDDLQHALRLNQSDAKDLQRLLDLS